MVDHTNPADVEELRRAFDPVYIGLSPSLSAFEARIAGYSIRVTYRMATMLSIPQMVDRMYLRAFECMYPPRASQMRLWLELHDASLVVRDIPYGREDGATEVVVSWPIPGSVNTRQNFVCTPDYLLAEPAQAFADLDAEYARVAAVFAATSPAAPSPPVARLRALLPPDARVRETDGPTPYVALWGAVTLRIAHADLTLPDDVLRGSLHARAIRIAYPLTGPVFQQAAAEAGAVAMYAVGDPRGLSFVWAIDTPNVYSLHFTQEYCAHARLSLREDIAREIRENVHSRVRSWGVAPSAAVAGSSEGLVAGLRHALACAEAEIKQLKAEITALRGEASRRVRVRRRSVVPPQADA